MPKEQLLNLTAFYDKRTPIERQEKEETRHYYREEDKGYREYHFGEQEKFADPDGWQAVKYKGSM